MSDLPFLMTKAGTFTPKAIEALAADAKALAEALEKIEGLCDEGRSVTSVRLIRANAQHALARYRGENSAPTPQNATEVEVAVPSEEK